MALFSARNAALAARDLFDGFASVHVWGMLAWQEIRQRYRRSKLGPFWLTLSTGALLGGMGPLYGRLLNTDIGGYFGYLATSFVVWGLIAGIVNDSCSAFIASESIIKQIRLPLSIHVLRVVWRNFIVFFHNLIIVAIVLAFFPPENFGWTALLSPVGLLLVAFNGVWIGIFLGMVCARFRDVPQIVGSVVQVFFFLTPVLWKANMLGRHAWAAEWNPFFHFLEVVRAPLLTGTIPTQSWAAVALITVVGWTGTFLVFSRFRARVPYWV